MQFDGQVGALRPHLFVGMRKYLGYALGHEAHVDLLATKGTHERCEGSDIRRHDLGLLGCELV